MMDNTVYRPVLPDDNSSGQLCPEVKRYEHNRGVFPPTNAQRQQQQQQQQQLQQKQQHCGPKTLNTNKPEEKTPVHLSNNKVLIIGLLIIVVVLITVIVIQIRRHRKSTNNDTKRASHTERVTGGDQNTHHNDFYDHDDQQHHKNQRQSEDINDNMLREYMKKTPRKLKERKSSMATHANGKSTRDDDNNMYTIIEDGTTLEDKEYSQMRNSINTILHTQKDDDVNESMETGSQRLQDAEDDARISMSQAAYQPKISDEALIEQECSITEYENSDDGYAKDDDEQNESCMFVLVSGKRVGQNCGRKCVDTTCRCVRHKDK
jgi:hypothetical protein